MKKTICSITLLIIIIIASIFMFKGNSIKTLTNDNFKNTIEKNYYSVVYFGGKSDKINDLLKSFSEIGTIKTYYADMDINDINKHIKELGEIKDKDVFILFANYDPLFVMENNLTLNEYSDYINYYFYNIIPKDQQNYKTIDADVYLKKVNSKDYVVTVFGKDDCDYCNKYMPVFNKVAGDYKLDVYFFDKNQYDKDEYEKIMNLDLKIPSKCTTDGKDTTFKNGFPKPMTVITKSGKFVDCIKGYVTEDVLVNKLKEYKIIKE